MIYINMEVLSSMEKSIDEQIREHEQAIKELKEQKKPEVQLKTLLEKGGYKKVLNVERFGNGLIVNVKYNPVDGLYGAENIEEIHKLGYNLVAFDYIRGVDANVPYVRVWYDPI